ncbi:filament-like plant protein 1 [Phaseolus vulgaris]|uniref:filament-like plant protein 1 n=1 Tax=Phaseolus vulgaris TaxID=3885 RepID=UPI0035CB7C93
MATTRRGTARAAPAELSMQQVLEIMRGLQEDMAESKLEQERMQADREASHERNEMLHRINEELRRGLRNNRGQREHDETENHSPPREVSTPFSQEILDAVIPNTFARPKVIFTGMEDPETHLAAFHTQMGLVGSTDAAKCKLFMSTLTGVAMDWFISQPDGHITSFRQLSPSQAIGQPTPPAGSDSTHSGGFPRLPASPPPPTSAATAEGGEASSQPNSSGASNENFSRVIALVRHFIRSRELLEWSGQEVDMHLAKQIVLSLEFSTQHHKQLVLEKRVKELEHDKESLQSDFEAAQGSIALMRDTVEKSRKEYLPQVQETIKTEILMGQAVNTLDSEVVELRSKIINLEAETSSLPQLNSQLAGDLKSTKEEATDGGKKLEKAVSELSAVKVELAEAKGKLEEAASSIASLTTEKNALETSKQELEAENAELMNVGADALADGFELAFEQIRCVLPDLDLTQFNIYHKVVDGKLIPPS